MFYIDNLISPTIQEQLDKIEYIENQAVFLLQLLDYTAYFPDVKDEISSYCKSICNRVYDMSLFRKVAGDRAFIMQYARKCRSLKQVKNLIDALCSSIDEDVDNYDEIIDKAKDELILIEDISDFEFSDSKSKKTEDNAKTAKKTSIKDILKYKDIK